MKFKKTAKLDLNGNGWDAEFVARWLNTYTDQVIPENTKKWMRNMAARAKQKADEGYSRTKKYDPYHPFRQPRVTTKATKNRLTVTAFGQEVVFAEFGAGYYADAGKNELSPGLMQEGIVVYPGTFSDSEDGMGYIRQTDLYGGPIPLKDWQYNMDPGRGLNTAVEDLRQTYVDMGRLAFEGVDITKSND